jgi:DNA-binding GntR family transcriptional regulator
VEGRAGGRAPDGSRSDQAYALLKPRLLVGDFGLNQRLGEERLAAEMGVSRTPVREALARLHAERLVVRAPDGGYLPAAPDPSQSRHLYEVRIGLEVQALRRPGLRGEGHDRDTLEALADEWRSLEAELAAGIEPDPEFVLLDEAFHVRLAHAAGNPVLASLLQQVNEQIRLVRMQDFLLPERIAKTVDEHLGILDSVLAGRIEEAEQRFDDHVAVSLAVVEERVGAAISRMVRGGNE